MKSQQFLDKMLNEQAISENIATEFWIHYGKNGEILNGYGHPENFYHSPSAKISVWRDKQAVQKLIRRMKLDQYYEINETDNKITLRIKKPLPHGDPSHETLYFEKVTTF